MEIIIFCCVVYLLCGIGIVRFCKMAGESYGFFGGILSVLLAPAFFVLTFIVMSFASRKMVLKAVRMTLS